MTVDAARDTQGVGADPGDMLDALERALAALRAGLAQPARALVATMPRSLRGQPAQVLREAAQLLDALDDPSALPLCGDQAWSGASWAAQLALDRLALRHDPQHATRCSPRRLERVLWSASDGLASLPWGPVWSLAIGSPRERVAASATASVALAVADLTLTPEQGSQLLRQAARHPHQVVRALALRALRAPWVVGDLEPTLREAWSERALGQDAAALALAHGLRDALRQASAQDGPCDDLALAALGALGDPQDLALILERSLTQPERLAPSARQAVEALHQRGVFPGPAQLDALLTLYDAHPGWSAAAMARVTYTCRHALAQRLVSLDPADAGQARRAALLAQVSSPAAQQAFRRLLDQPTCCDEVAAALLGSSSTRWRVEDEQALLRWVERPGVAALALQALHGHGSPLAWRQIWARCLADPLALGPARGDALRGVAARGLDVPRAQAPPPGALAALERVALQGGPEALEQAAPLWLELLEEVERRRQPAGSPGSLEAAAEQALLALGRRLRDQGWPQQEAAWPLRELATQLVEQQARPTLLVLALDALRRHGMQPRHASAVLARLRDRRPEVVRAAMDALLSHPDAARGLEFTLALERDAREPAALTRQRLRAVACFELRHAEAWTLAQLDHPNMDLKKRAAEALALIGSARSAGRLVELLGQWHNPELRALLWRALERCARESAHALVLQALGAASGARRDVLLEALSGRLSAAQVALLVRRGHQVGALLEQHAMAGRLTLSDDVRALRVALRQVQAPELSHDDPLQQAVSALHGQGYSPALAQAALEAYAQPGQDQAPASQELLGCVRARWPEWAAWAASTRSPGACALVARASLGLQGVQTQDGWLLDCLEALWDGPDAPLAWEALAHAASHRGRADAQDRAPRWRWRALEQARRRRPASGVMLARWTILRELGAIEVEDVERLLADGALEPDASQACASLLTRLAGERALAERAATHVRACLEATSPAQRRGAIEALLALGTEVAPDPLAQEPSRLSEPPRWDQACVESWLARVAQGDARAARQVLEAPQARRAWPQVLTLALEGRVKLEAWRLGPLLQTWPEDAAQAERACAWLSHVPAPRLARWIEGWLDAWACGWPWASRALSAVSPGWWLGALRARQGAGQWSDALALARISDEHDRAQLQACRLALAGELAQAQAAPLASAALTQAPDEAPTLEALAKLAHRSRGDAALDAIKRLARLGEPATQALLALTRHKEARARAGALRALRQAASPQVYEDAALAMLEVEPKAPLRGQLIRIVAHRRHPRAARALAALALSRTPATAEAASWGLRQLGERALPELRRARSRARPDHALILSRIEAQIEAQGSEEQLGHEPEGQGT